MSSNFETRVYLRDDELGRDIALKLVAHKDGIEVRSVDNDDVYIGIEVIGGVLRGTFGPEAEVLSDDIGFIIGETI